MDPNLENVRKKSWSPIVANFKHKNDMENQFKNEEKKNTKQKKHQVY
jgi:hypothetical protein